MDNTNEFMTRLYREYSRPMYRFALSIVHDEGHAADVVQEAFMKLLRRAEILRHFNGKSLHSYIAQTIHNTAIDLVRKHKVMWHMESSEAIADSGGPIHAYTEPMEGYTELVALINNLSETYRDAVCLRLVHCLPYEDIAKRLGITVHNAQKRVSRGRQLLILQLTEGDTP